jgi:hypothetical protein
MMILNNTAGHLINTDINKYVKELRKKVNALIKNNTRLVRRVKVRHYNNFYTTVQVLNWTLTTGRLNSRLSSSLLRN